MLALSRHEWFATGCLHKNSQFQSSLGISLRLSKCIFEISCLFMHSFIRCGKCYKVPYVWVKNLLKGANNIKQVNK